MCVCVCVSRRNSAYIFTGGLDYELTEGDLLAVFAQYGEVVDVHLVRDKKTGKSRGFAFLAYEDQRSTVLSVDNLNGARVSGRVIRVEHVENYKKKRAEVRQTRGLQCEHALAQLTSTTELMTHSCGSLAWLRTRAMFEHLQCGVRHAR